MRARKRFGQNFLTDRHTIERIIGAINPKPNEHILEIGPGHGELTDSLVSSGCRLDVIEIDRDLAATLKDRYPAINLVIADVLKQDFAAMLGEGPVRVVGNLPYNISTPLLFRLFAHLTPIADMHFMLQLEVVERMAAGTGDKAYGRLSIMTQYHCAADKLFAVDASAFTPRPRVTSAIVRLTPQNVPHRGTERALDDHLLSQLVNRAFTQRRKTIRNALGDYLSQDELVALGLDPSIRPENLTLQNYIACANHVSRRSPN